MASQKLSAKNGKVRFQPDFLREFVCWLYYCEMQYSFVNPLKYIALPETTGEAEKLSLSLFTEIISNFSPSLTTNPVPVDPMK